MSRQHGVMSEDEVVRWLHAMVGQAGGIHAWAAANGTSDQLVDAVYHRRRPPGGTILRIMGLERVRMYRARRPTTEEA